MPELQLSDLTDADRRSVLKFLGVGGAAAAGTGIGIISLTDSAAAAEVNISAQDPDTTMSDDGDVDEVYVKPTLSVTWDGFDDVVGKVRILIEAATGEIDLDGPEIEELDFTPVFRATGYANDTDNDVEQETGPGTNGEFTLDWFSGEKHVTVYGGGGKPDYENATYNCGATMETYLDGSLMGDPIDGALNGFYGPAGDTDRFQEDTDGGTNVTTVYLRYTVSLHVPDVSFIQEDNYALETTDIAPFSPLAMAEAAGQDSELLNADYSSTVSAEEAGEYEEFSEGDSVPATAVPYGVLQDNTDHPAIMSDFTRFSVEVENEPATAGVTGDSDAGVSVEEDIGTRTDEDDGGTGTDGGNETATETPDSTETPTEAPTETPASTETATTDDDTTAGNTTGGGNQTE